MSQDSITLVVGASGTVGSGVVQLLTSSGADVRAATHKPIADRNNVVHLNVATGEGIEDAFTGVDRAFLMSPPGIANQYSALSPLVTAAKRHRLKKVVLMTAMGADAVETSPMRRAELELERSGVAYNIIRPNWFMQNFNTFWLSGIRAEGKILLPAGTAKVSFVDARDISAVAAKLLLTDTHERRAFDLTGPDAIDHSEVAAAIARATGKPVRYKEVAPEILRQGLAGAGMPADYIDFLVTIFGFLREGYNARTTQNVKELTGMAPRGIDAYVKDYRDAWL